jgi:hypothetical protein
MSSIIVTPDRLRPDLDEPDGPRSWVLPSDPQSAAVRLQAYSGGYPARIHESLEEGFPAVARIIGHQRLVDLTERYIRRVALRSYNLNDAGTLLPRFLHTDPLATEFPFLPDLAKLEWLVVKAFHARQLQPMDPASVAHWSLDQWHQAVFRFQPFVALLVSRWPVLRIWTAAQREDRRIEERVRAQRTYVLVRRASFTVQCDSVVASEAQVLTGLLGARTLGEVTEGLGRRVRPGNLSRWFARWVAAGLITRCSVRSS